MFTCQAKTNKKLKQLKTMLFFTLLHSLKHYTISSNNVWRVNITRRHYGLHDSKLAKCLDCKRFDFTFFAQRFSVICNRRSRKGLFIDLSNEYKFTYVKRDFFPQKSPPLLLVKETRSYLTPQGIPWLTQDAIPYFSVLQK